MPFDDPDPTDPMTFHAVTLEVEDDGAMREMVRCFIEEYARQGFDAERLLRLFENRHYAGPNLAWRALGREVIGALIEEELRGRPGRPVRPSDADDGSRGRVVPLPVNDG